MERLPREILEKVLDNSKLFTRFDVATLSKNLYEKIRHIPLKKEYHINTKDGHESIGSFFFATVNHVNVVIDDMPINFGNLRKMLSVFYCLHTVTLTGCLTQRTANKLVGCLPLSPSTIKLNLYCEPDTMSMIGNALKNITQRQIVVKDKGYQRKKRKYDHPQPIETPSPLKPALRPLKLAYEASKAELCKAMEIKPKSKAYLPAPLVKHNLASGNYTTKISERFKNIDLTEEFGVNEINTVATNISKLLIEAILQFEDQWFFVTEYEMYVRNRSQVDDCAQESWWLMYPGEVEAYIVKKNEKGNTWFEVSIFWDRLEFLVTGGVRGNYSDGTLTPFLGSAQKHLEPMNLQTHTRTSNIIIREEGAEVSQTTRRLRQYKKQAAHLKWLFRSSKFVRKGFHTTVSLEVHLNLAKANMASVASFLLSRVVEKKFEESDVKHTLKLIADTSAFPLNKRSMTLRTFKKDYRQMNLSPSYQSIFKCFIYLSEGKIEELTGDDILSVYKGTLANYCKNEDEKKLRRNTHLL